MRMEIETGEKYQYTVREGNSQTLYNSFTDCEASEKDLTREIPTVNLRTVAGCVTEDWIIKCVDQIFKSHTAVLKVNVSL